MNMNEYDLEGYSIYVLMMVVENIGIQSDLVTVKATAYNSLH